MVAIGTALDRIGDLVRAQGYALAKTPFDFDQIPTQALDKQATMTADRVDADAYLGGAESAVYRTVVFLAQKVKGDAWGAQRALHVDAALLRDALLADVTFTVLDNTDQIEVRQPGVDRDYAIARLQTDILVD